MNGFWCIVNFAISGVFGVWAVAEKFPPYGMIPGLLIGFYYLYLWRKRNLTSKCSGPDNAGAKCTGCTITDIKEDCPVHVPLISGR